MIKKLGKSYLKKRIEYTIFVCLVFGLYFLINEFYFSKIYNFIELRISLYPFSFALTYLIIGIPILLFVFFTNEKKLLIPFGLYTNISQGVLLGFIFSIPMFVGYGIMGSFNIVLDSRTFWFLVVFAAFFEEFYYRGFFFGQLFKKTRLGFIPSLFLSALVFASLHLYQSNDLSTLIGIFIVTFMGAGLFAWLYVEWNYNLWLPIALHLFMNLSWSMFDISDNALGSVEANVYRGLTIVFAIVGTLLWKKKNGLALIVNKDTLLKKR